MPTFVFKWSVVILNKTRRPKKCSRMPSGLQWKPWIEFFNRRHFQQERFIVKDFRAQRPCQATIERPVQCSCIISTSITVINLAFINKIAKKTSTATNSFALSRFQHLAMVMVDKRRQGVQKTAFYSIMASGFEVTTSPLNDDWWSTRDKKNINIDQPHDQNTATSRHQWDNAVLFIECH